MAHDSSPESLPACGRVNHDADGNAVECAEVGDHFCIPRADHAQQFFEELLVHTKGKHARKRFLLADWQRDDIVRPLFGRTVWSAEHEAYVRQYRIAYIELARKNGKSQLLAGIMLYLLFADGEYSAELFGVAKDRKQAALVFDVAAQMVLLSPVLARSAKVIKSTRRIVRFETNSVYQVIAADAASALGSNPSGVAADELLAWPKDDMWDALRSGMGSMDRMQPLMVAATTAAGDTESFGGRMHSEMQRIVDDPTRSPHTFAYIRNLPLDADIYDESNWHIPNPAIASGFLSLAEMRKMALEARNDPAREHSFRRFQLNQHIRSAMRWMPMNLWDAAAGTVFRDARSTMDAFAGREAWFGLDLAARQDLCAICYLFPDGESADAVWRFWCPEAALMRLDNQNAGRFSGFAAQGWLTVTDGDVLDFSRVYDDIAADAQRFTLLGGDADKWSSDPVIQEIENRTYVQEIYSYTNDFTHMSDGMHRILEMTTQQKFRHHGNPLARFCFDSCDARTATYNPDLIRPDKPDRSMTAKRIDAVPAAVMAVNAWITRGDDVKSVYAENDLLIL